jgi:uncharacterized membrane protein
VRATYAIRPAPASVAAAAPLWIVTALSRLSVLRIPELCSWYRIYHITHPFVSVRILLAFLNSQSSADVMLASTANSVTNQSLNELKLHEI